MSRLLSVALFVALPGVAFAAPWGDLPSDPTAAAAEVDQRALPALRARAESAEKQVAAREGYFAGKTPFETAFPDLVGARLDARAVLDGRLLMLDERAEGRAVDRVTPVPDLGSADLARRVVAASAAALDAEERSDALERRLLLSLRAFVDGGDGGLAAIQAELRLAVEAAVVAEAAASEADRPARSREAARLDDERRITAALADAVRTRVTVPGAPPLDVAEDLARADDPATAAWALRRLVAVRTLVDPASGERVDALVRAAWERELPELEAERDAAVAKVATPEVVADAAAAEALTASLAVLEAAVTTAAAAEAAAAEGPERDVARLRAEIATARRDAAVASLTAWKGRQGTAGTSASRARTEADAATAAAAEAKEAAGTREALRIAELQTAEAAASHRAAEAWEQADALEKKRVAVEALRSTSLDDIQVRAAAVTTRGLLGGGDADGTYRDLRALQHTTRLEVLQAGQDAVAATEALQAAEAAVEADREVILTARGGLPADPALRESTESTLAKWEEVLADEIVAHETAVKVAIGSRDDAMHALQEIRELRWVLSRKVSAAERAADRAQLPNDAFLEARLLAPMFEVVLRDRVASLRALPSTLLDLDRLVAMFRGSLWLFAIGLGWWFARRRVGRMADAALPLIGRAVAVSRARDLPGIKPPLERVIRATLNLVLGLLVIGPVGRVAPELWLLLFWYVHLVGYRALLALFDLLVVPYADTRIGLVELTAPVFDLTRRTVRLLLVWLIARRFTVQLLEVVLSLYTITGIARFGFTVAGIVLVALLLQRWEPLLRARISGLDRDSWLVNTLAAEPPYRVLYAPHAAGILVYIAVVAGWDLVNRQASEREGFGRLVNVLNRYRFVTHEASYPPLPPDAAARILGHEHDPDVALPRDDERVALSAAFSAWTAERRRGLVALVGDRGEGKSTLVAAFAAEREGTTLRMAEGVLTEAQVVAWLADALGVHAESRTDLVAALGTLDPRVIVIEDAHRCFLRAVDGFDALRVLLYVLNATSDRHFWLVTFHRPAWRYLSRLASLVNVHVFRAVVELRPMGEPRLRRFAIGRTVAAGYQPNFAGLVRRGPLGGDPATELERAVATFFRLLAEASAGNPSVALRLWLQCLTPGDAPSELKVWMHPCLGAGTLPDLSEPDLFTLVALRTQDALDEPRLVAVTNLGEGVVRSTVKNLQQRGIVEVVDPGVRITTGELAAVTRTLRRRHFLQTS